MSEIGNEIINGLKNLLDVLENSEKTLDKHFRVDTIRADCGCSDFIGRKWDMNLLICETCGEEIEINVTRSKRDLL